MSLIYIKRSEERHRLLRYRFWADMQQLFVFRWCGESWATQQDQSRPSDSSSLGISSKVLYSSSSTFLLLIFHETPNRAKMTNHSQLQQATRTLPSTTIFHVESFGVELWITLRQFSNSSHVLYSVNQWTLKAIICMEITLFDD